MQKLDTFGDIKKYTHKTIFASFFVNCVVNIVFLLASCYTYFVINTISTTRDIYKIITPTIITLILCAFAYTLIIKRDNLILSTSRFLDYLLFRHLIKIGIIINANTNSNKTAKKIINDYKNIKTFITNKSIIGIFDLPWIVLSIVVISYFSYINALMVLLCVFFCCIISVIENKYKKLQNIAKSNENYDFIQQLFDDSKFVKCNFNYDNIIKKIAIENNKNYKEINKYAQKIAFLQSFIRFLISLIQIAVFLSCVVLIMLEKFNFGEFVLTIILANRTLNMITTTLSSIANFSNIRKSYARINDAIDKTYNILQKQKPQLCNKLAIELKDVSYIDYTTQKNIFDNLNGIFVGGEIYVIQDKNIEKKQTFLQLISSIYLPSTGNINNFNLDNGYDFISYYQQEPISLDAKIVDFISGFEEQLDLVKIDNIITALKIDEIDKSKYGLETILQQKNTYSKEFLRKLNLARIIYRNTNVIILEEPFENIDKTTAQYLVDYINTYKKLGKMVILSADNLDNEYIKQLSSINIVSFQQTEE